MKDSRLNRAAVFSHNSNLELAGRWVLGTLFVYAAGHKIIAPADFAKILYGYGLFPGEMINLAAIILPFVELFAGFFLMAGVFPRSAALVIDILLFLFIVVIAINLVRGHQFDCGCFSFGGPEHASAAVQLLIRDFICLIMGLHVLYYPGRRRWCLRQTGGLLNNIWIC